MKLKRTFKILFLHVLCIYTLRCTSEPENFIVILPETSRPVEIQFPVGSETFYLGEAVILRWRVDTKRIHGVVPYISIDDGETWCTICTTGVVYCKDCTGDETVNFKWIIGQEYAPERPDYSSNNDYEKCKIKVEDCIQSGLPYSVSKKFTITSRTVQ